MSVPLLPLRVCGQIPSLPLRAFCVHQEAPGGSRGIGVTIRVAILLILAVTSSTPAARADEPRPLFDGASLAGWETIEADARWWKAADGMLVGGSLTELVPQNTFLSTKERFENFELAFKIRVRGTEGFINSGIQIRSTRVPNSPEMCGYQVDAGPGWWGKLYDESRRNKVIGEPIDGAAVNAAVKPDDWNEYRIRAEGPRIRSWINGVAALDYREPDAAIPLDGHIGFQVHGGGKALVEVKDVAITALPPTPAGAAAPKGPPPAGPLSAAEEAQHFSLADGFTAELVLAESEDAANPYGKFVALAFDAHGRLWTTTALEYPVDANEDPEASRRLFAEGGRDKVLVVDDPWAAKPSPPRVFADGLAMPLSVLPLRDGAFMQYGPEIRFYRDTNGDGRADKHETVLEGFGVQDSHLFPHQFTRVPGGWILLAQGLFNTSQVKRPGGAAFADGSQEIRFAACKLARFKPDGSAFESVTAGPNNIWGLTISRTGETWLQEANDIGYPLFPYEPGVLVATGSPDRLRPYQPLMPAPLAPPQMGGSGLSGLALADDLDGWPAPWGAGAGLRPRRADLLRRQSDHELDPVDHRHAGGRAVHVSQGARSARQRRQGVSPRRHPVRPRRLPLRGGLVQQGDLAQRGAAQPSRPRPRPRPDLADQACRAAGAGAGRHREGAHGGAAPPSRCEQRPPRRPRLAGDRRPRREVAPARACAARRRRGGPGRGPRRRPVGPRRPRRVPRRRCLKNSSPIPRPTSGTRRSGSPLSPARRPTSAGWPRRSSTIRRRGCGRRSATRSAGSP